MTGSVNGIIGGQAGYNTTTSAGGILMDTKVSAGIKFSSASDNYYWGQKQPDFWGTATADVAAATPFTLYAGGGKPIIGGATLGAGYNSFTSDGADGLYGAANASFTGGLPLAGGRAQIYSSNAGAEVGIKKDFTKKSTGGIGVFGTYTNYTSKNDPIFTSNVASGVRFTIADTSKSNVVKSNLDIGGQYEIASKQVKPYLGLGATVQFGLGEAK